MKRKNSRNIILALSRDGGSLGIAPFGNFEMPSVKTLSVYCDGSQLGTIYLAFAAVDHKIGTRVKIESEVHDVGGIGKGTATEGAYSGASGTFFKRRGRRVCRPEKRRRQQDWRRDWTCTGFRVGGFGDQVGF